MTTTDMARHETAGVFTLKFSLFTSSGGPNEDIQFGMDFSLTTTVRRPLSQLIFPAVAVGNNRPGQWNVDNHNSGHDLESLIFPHAEGGTINDPPREISRRHKGVLNTKFAVFLVDLKENSVQSVGVQFGYSINTSDATPKTTFTGLTQHRIANDQKAVMLARAPHIKFV